MSYFTYNGKILVSNGKLIGQFVSLPSESYAISKMQSFYTALNAFMAVEDRLPTSQAELDPDYMNFNPDPNYTYSYAAVDTSIGYFNATSANAYVHSFTRTASWSGGILNDIICSKIGVTPPGPADYIGGVLSCQFGTQEV
jgi:hypothetical protein